MRLRPRVIRCALQREVEGDLEIEFPGARDEVAEILVGAQIGVDGVVATLVRPDRPGGPDVVGPATNALFGPFRLILPIGWIGGRYTTSNPMAAMRGRSAAAVAKVPCRGVPSSFQPPVERGKNSYHEPNSARRRSAIVV